MIVFDDMLSGRPFVAMMKEFRPVYALQMACAALVCASFFWAIWRLLRMRRNKRGLAVGWASPAAPARFGLAAGIASVIVGVLSLGPFRSYSSITDGPRMAVNASILPLYLGLVVASGGILQHSIITFLVAGTENGSTIEDGHQ